jgi:tRNA(fMet)-specific endonuclease VapC
LSISSINVNRIIVDTDVFSFIFGGHTQAQYFEHYLSNKTLAVSFMTVAELYYGAYKDKWGMTKISRLENQLKNYVVLPYDYLLCQKWAEIKRKYETDHNQVIEPCDCWIAATAIRFNCPLATGNGKHFQYISDLTLISPGLA